MVHIAALAKACCSDELNLACKLGIKKVRHCNFLCVTAKSCQNNWYTVVPRLIGLNYSRNRFAPIVA